MNSSVQGALFRGDTLNLLCIIEQRYGKIIESSLETVGAARALGGHVTALLPGEVEEKAALEKCGADEVVIVKGEGLKNYTYRPYRDVLLSYIESIKPDAVIGEHTSQGMDLYPGVALRASMPYLPDCISISSGDMGLSAVRQIYGGKIEAVYSVPGRCFITIRPGAFKPVEGAATLRIDEAQVNQSSGSTFVAYRSPPKEDVDIEKAKIVVAVGRGIEKQENLKLFEELVKRLDGAVLAGSRPIIDSGWLPKGRQVGVSGKTVKPKLYLALGISGAIQHLSGMMDSELIVAVNKDREAPIFKVAHIGIVDDIFKFVPAFMKELEGK